MRRVLLGLVGCSALVAAGLAIGAGGAMAAVAPTVTASNWTAVNAPSVSDQADATALSVNGVACATSDFCVAVGQQNEFNATTLIQQWNGSSWSLVPGATPSQSGILSGVSCAGPSFCVSRSAK